MTLAVHNLADVIRRSPARWPAGSEICPTCGGEAAFALPGTNGQYTQTVARFECGECDTAWQVAR